MVDITYERLREVLTYDPKTGIFTWRVDKSQRVKVGHVAGTIDRSGYCIIGVDGEDYAAHRLAWIYMTGEWPARRLDHKDTYDKSNRWDNLRLATAAENARNGRLRSSNKSGYKGVSWFAPCKKWQALIMVDGRSIYLGVYDDPAAAHAAYVDASKKYHGDFGRAS